MFCQALFTKKYKIYERKLHQKLSIEVCFRENYRFRSRSRPRLRKKVIMRKSFKDMQIWQVAMCVAERIFELSEDLPRKEDYGLTSQIRRSSLSISANIAEAFGRYHIFDKIKFYFIARGSITETQSHLEYGSRVGYFSKEIVKKLDSDLEDICKDLNKIIVTLRNKRN